MNVLLDSNYFKFWSENANLAKSTKIGYKSKLKCFGIFLMNKGAVHKIDFDNFYYIEEDGSYDPIDEDFMDEYVESLIEEGLSDQLLYQNISIIKSFLHYLKSVGMIKTNPLKYYKNPYYRLVHRDRTMSKQECVAVLNAAYKLDPFTKKYYVLVLLLLTCGLRKQELLKMKKSQISFEFSQIEITRGQKTTAGVVRMTELLKKELKSYIEHPAWIEWSEGHDKEVFFEIGKPLSEKKIYRVMKKIYKIAGITRRIRLHDYRHTCAFLMYSEGINVMTIKEQLRHAKLATTLHYLPPGNDLAKILELNSTNRV
ncbi:site-specific integrase [Peribacillus saganii]|uniref:Site-specific integrase n=1 Tax=Peribacillus saganii TaxID=2303992 RepID=A0A372LL41_9BACI|nr:site-specific integrase [Peribacillus saganii]RFU67472.1 site-specific integrase [Peribacillus saganii]